MYDVCALAPVSRLISFPTCFRYWTSYRASKLYVLNLYVMEGFIDMSEDWDSHVDQVITRPLCCPYYHEGIPLVPSIPVGAVAST